MRYLLQTFGCQMNVHDSDRMEELLAAHGWARCDSADDADLVLFNTCSVREKAEQKLRSEVGKLAPLKRARPELVVAIAGCVAQQEGERLLQRIRHVDLVIGPDNLAELPALVRAQQAGSPPAVRTVFDVTSPAFLSAAPGPGRAAVSAFVTTMKGCDERCSFCVVPYTRGPERYRPAREIVAEIRALVAAGTREVILLGQTVDSFRDPHLPPLEGDEKDDPDASQFPALLRLIAREAPDLARLRYTSPHPRHATAGLARAHAELDVLAHHVHLPVQSGSDRVLKRMIRRYTRAEYVERAQRLRATRPGMTLSSDFIVGFPGETDADFEATLDLVREVGFTQAFAFKFSPRPHTPALKLRDDVPESTKSQRLAALLAQVEIQGRAHLDGLVGTRARVLVEGPSKSRDLFQGRTQRNEIVHLDPVPGRDLTGVLLDVEITVAHNHSLAGRILGDLSTLPVAALSPSPPSTLPLPGHRALPVLA